MRGMLAAYSGVASGSPPTVVSFQYNPTEVTRVLRLQKDDSASGGGSALNTRDTAIEEYTLTLELDATDGLEKGAPLTTALGIAPRLAALELLMEPVGTSTLGDLLSSGSRPATLKLPLVLLIWGPGRIAPVVLTSLKISETAFDELLNPIHASADLGFQVLGSRDVSADDAVAQAAIGYYQGARAAKAVLQAPQVVELGS